jgi:hypothetical protein
MGHIKSFLPTLHKYPSFRKSFENELLGEEKPFGGKVKGMGINLN